jgi:hypothetical protein
MLLSDPAVPSGSDFAIGLWHAATSIRGAGHTVTYTDQFGAGNAFVSVSVLEITGQDSPDYDATTGAAANDTVAPIDLSITAAGPIAGSQIAVVGITQNGTNNVAWTDPAGYTSAINQPDGATHLPSYLGYKIGETGTPTVTAVRADASSTVGRMAFATFKAPGGSSSILVPQHLVVGSLGGGIARS